MMSLDYRMKQYLPELIREDRWTILTALILDSNADNRCWPSGKRIHNVTGKSQTTITKAKQWLIKHGAIELVPHAERSEREKVLPRRQHVYKLTGQLDFNGEKIPYFFQSQSNATNMEIPASGNSTTLKFQPVETKYYTEESNSSEVNTINTDDRVLSSPADAGQGDPTPQSYDMVSDHVNDSGEMVAAESVNGGVLVETHEDPPTSSVPPPPSVRKVNKHGTTVITPRDPIFDSVARLQFGIADTSDMPKGFGARIARIVKVIVDAYKQRNNVTALSPQEREGLAGIHANFWIWYTTVKYPTRGNEPAKELKSDVKFAEYWLEYRAYRNAPKPEPKSTVKDWVWTEEGYKLV